MFKPNIEIEANRWKINGDENFAIAIKGSERHIFTPSEFHGFKLTALERAIAWTSEG